MDLSSISPTLLVASLMVAATPILLATIGELVVEKSGVLNLGVEGMMIIGAIAGFAAAVGTGSPIIGFLCAALGGAALSLVFALLTQFFLSNQVATGLALTLFGLGLSALMGQSYIGIKPPASVKLDLPVISDLPILGPILFSHDITVYAALGLVAGVWWFLKYTRGGLILRAVGESHDAAHTLGYKVVKVRIMAIMFGGACAGLGGGVSVTGARAAVDRRYDSRSRLDCLGDCCFCELETGTRSSGCLSFRRRCRFAAQSAGRWCLNSS